MHFLTFLNSIKPAWLSSLSKPLATLEMRVVYRNYWWYTESLVMIPKRAIEFRQPH